MLTIREVAVLLGRSERTVRAQVARGDLPGKKRGGRWLVPRDALPLTEAQRQALQARCDQIRTEVERALPGRLASSARDRRRSLADLMAFERGRRLLAAMRASAGQDGDPAGADQARACLHQALLDLSVGFHEYNRPGRLAALTRTRAGLAQAGAHLLLEAGDPVIEPAAAWVRALEQEVLPPLAGLFRRAENLPRPARRAR